MLDLPLPFGPVMAQASPKATLNVASRTAVTSPYVTDIPVTARAGVSPLPGTIRGRLAQHGAFRERPDQALVDRQPAYFAGPAMGFGVSRGKQSVPRASRAGGPGAGRVHGGAAAVEFFAWHIQVGGAGRPRR